LAGQLTTGVVGVSLIYWLAVAGFTYSDSVAEVNQLFDEHLEQTAWALLRLADPDDIPPVKPPRGSALGAPVLPGLFGRWPELPERLAQQGAHRTGDAGATLANASAASAMVLDLDETYERHLRYQVWSGDGTLLLRSANAPETPMSALDGHTQTVDAQGRPWRQFAVWDRHGDFRILVSEAQDWRARLVQRIAWNTARPLLLGLPLLLLLLWLSVRRSLKSLGALARDIEHRAPDSLEPLDAAGAPREVLPMVQSLNGLLKRMTHALEGERRFTANAAHELRTPLAALQAHLHLLRVSGNETERQAALQQLQRGVERGIRLVGQLLTLARLDPEQALHEAQTMDLAETVQALCAELAPLALQRQQTLELDVDDGVPAVCGHADLVAMLVGNLVDNAIRYTPRGGHIDVAVRRCDDGAFVTVSDDGPGIGPEKHTHVFERFVRLPGHQEPGNGLGLTICARIAELHCTQVTLDAGPAGRGLLASVKFNHKPEEKQPTTEISKL
jgi:two-component system sensor histidine kinase QseC